MKAAGLLSLMLVAVALAGGQPAAAALDAGQSLDIAVAPEPIAPANGSTTASFGPTLQWALPSGTTQYHLQVTPAQNDGPGINLIVGVPGDSFTIPAPPNWYGLLPEMTYSWRLRASESAAGLTENDTGWGPWSSTSNFRTPGATSASIALQTAGEVSGTTPILTWSDTNPGVYYYEVQVSTDPGFGPNSFLYWELRHGGVTSPRNSYQVPAAYPLREGTPYHWRVRPRIQGDGTPVQWSAARSFTVRNSPQSPQPQGNLLLQVTSPRDESTVTTRTVEVTGRTRPGAFVTINDVFAAVDASGNFRATISLDPGPNQLDILASDLEGGSASLSITVTYISP